jgi:hypothetical protein
LGGVVSALGTGAVNCWQHRLAELHGETGEQRSATLAAVQNLQSVQMLAPAPASEDFEQIVHSAKPPTPATPSVLDGAIASLDTTEQERAAVVGHDGKIPRTWAEGFAKLDPAQPPGDVPPRRWLRLVNDVGGFLDGPSCAIATALEWEPLDLFGSDRDRPYARIDQAGLLWLLDGNRLVALSENTATIESHTGTRQTYRRRPD